MSLGRALAAATYLLATLLWAGGMVVGRALACDDSDCTAGELHRMDISVVLSFVTLAVAVAALLGSLTRRWLGLSLLGTHVVVFAVNLGIYWGVADTPGVFIPLAALAAAAGYAAIDRLPRSVTS